MSRLKRASYRDAIYWIAANDDTVWIDDLDSGDTNSSPSVTACLVADLFGTTTDRVTDDIRRERDRIRAPK